MCARRDVAVRFRDALDTHYDGADAALRNAASLFDTADIVFPTCAPTASYLASMGAEETGKAILLIRRAGDLLHNAEVRLYTRIFHDDPEWTDGKKHLVPLMTWGVFAGPKGTHQGGLHDHTAKLTALRDYYAAKHDRVVEASDTRIVLESIDIFQGLRATDVRASVERSLYVSWDHGRGRWREPVECIRTTPDFTAAMRQVPGDLLKSVSSSRERERWALQHIPSMATVHSVPLRELYLL